MAGLFKRRAKPKGSPAQQLASALGLDVVAPVNNINLAPTQYRLLESRITRPSGVAAVLESLSQCSQLVPPGTFGNPETVEVPVSGHNLVLTMINRSAKGVSVTGLRAVYTSLRDYDFPSQLYTSAPDPMSARPAKEEADGVRTLEIPHYEVELSGVRPSIVEALLPDGERAREHVPFPLTIAPGRTARIVLAPVTCQASWISWRLVVRWREAGADLRAGWDLAVTGFSGWTISGGNGEVSLRPVGKLGHWDPRSLWDAGYTDYDEHLTVPSRPDPSWLKR